MESMALRAVLFFRLQFFIYSELEYISPAGRVLIETISKKEEIIK